MRRPRDYDAELQALDARAAKLKVSKTAQFGQLVIATGADALPVEILAGALLAAARETDSRLREGWRKAGAGFFQRPRKAARGAAPADPAAAPHSGQTLPPDQREGPR
jgi:DNA-binding protein H-NS